MRPLDDRGGPWGLTAQTHVIPVLQGQKQSAAGAAQRRLLRSGLAAFEQVLAESREQRATAFCTQRYTSRCADVTDFQYYEPIQLQHQHPESRVQFALQALLDLPC